MENLPSRPPMWLQGLQWPPVRLAMIGFVMLMMLMQSNTFMVQAKGQPLLQIAIVIAWAALGFAVYCGYVRYVERRPVTELGLAGMTRELGIGLAIGAGLYTGCVLILMVMGIYRIDGFNPLAFMLPAVAMALSSGIFEELLFRGVLFRIVEEWLGSWVSLIASSVVFGMVHLANPDATLTGAIFISVEAGLLLAAAYMLTRRLWMSMGFHMAWNYTQSAIFSGIVSGGVSDPGLIRPTIEGPDALTGGSFGLEASLIAFLLCTTTGIVLLIMAARRGHIVLPSWQRQRAGIASADGQQVRENRPN
ncbi:CPBP family intramembrane glutamic endopeptidase [Blastomonas sp.]|uniref:CPBP family intramembrane glutamic endopeptidase n=1 Tax=Blastomonas sp. TaxID=1909299 RepID=UPI002633F995|nr:CPBP family intramembrane glutamic endopeptidase [Blastomonas sp.]MDM7956066.1 CPBP family intramembrane metalloprotease [Blastomonas sp.]